MSKKVKKVSKSSKTNKKVVIHQSFRISPHHTDAFIKKYFFIGLLIVLAAFGVILFKGMMQPTEINVVTTGDGGIRGGKLPCAPKDIFKNGRCYSPVKAVKNTPTK